MTRGRRRAAPTTASAVVVLAVSMALGGCTALATPAERPDAAPTVSGSALAAEERAAVGGPRLVAEGRALDPVADDVDPDAECEGLPGREELEVFDRAAWPALDLPAGDATMTCGNASGAGWRHIADGHAGDFGELAELVGAEWEDVAWFAIDRALEQPTRVEAYRDDIVNYDVLVELVDDGGAERSWMVTVGVGLGSGRVITAFPDEQR